MHPFQPKWVDPELLVQPTVEVVPNHKNSRKGGRFVAIQKKTQWLKPQVTSFANARELLEYFAQRGDDGKLEKVKIALSEWAEFPEEPKVRRTARGR